MAYSILTPSPQDQVVATSDQQALSKADSSYIVAGLAKAKANGAPPWLSGTHPFQNGSLPRKRVDFEAVPNSRKLETLAVLGPLHFADGWRYFSRGLSAMLAGDAHAAKHLAYYAEMRAVLSLLSSAGIGVLGQQNIIVDSAGTVHALSTRSSHEMCWAVLEYWVTLPGSVEKLLGAVGIQGTPLFDLLRTYFSSPSSVSLGSRIMSEWGFDLCQGSQDREERNNSSYNPTALTHSSTSPEEDHAFLKSLWQAFEPGGALLEAHLFRKLLHIEQSVIQGAAIGERTSEYERLTEGAKSAVSQTFLAALPGGADELHLLTLAQNQQSPAAPSSMLARASLLLALAGGMVHQNFQSAAIDPIDDLETWWSPLGLESGCWGSEGQPDLLSDLWGDVELALEFSGDSKKTSRFDWHRGLADQLPFLSCAERIALWSICR